MMTRRLSQLFAGLLLYGFSMALLIEAGLGLDPWDVLHQGIAERTGLTIGTVVIVVGVLVLLLWIPLRQKPGVGTIANALLIGLAADASIWLLPAPEPLAVRIVFMVSGVMLNAVATAAYIGARLGPGPRDGLMTGLVRRTGRSVRLVRTSIEVVVLATGWLLGGTVGAGTVVYALSIGPLVHLLLPKLQVREPIRVAAVTSAS
nr:membrane protein [Jiangella alkaliphila]